MKNAKSSDSLIDGILIVAISAAAAFLLPWISAWFAELSLHFRRTLFWLHQVALSDLTPHILTGSIVGIVMGSLLRHRKLSLAALPSILVCTFSLFTFLSGRIRGLGETPFRSTW